MQIKSEVAQSALFSNPTDAGHRTQKARCILHAENTFQRRVVSDYSMPKAEHMTAVNSPHNYLLYPNKWGKFFNVLSE